MTTATRGRGGVALTFLVHGMVVGNWLARIPAVQQKLSLSMGALGFSLLGAAVGALLAMPLAARSANRLDTKLLTRLFALCFCASLPLPGVVPSRWLLGPALVVYGAAGGCMNVLMNTKGVELERSMGRPLMAGFHALFSIGAMIGAGMGALAAYLGVTPALHLLVAALFLGCIAAVAGWLLPPGRGAEPYEPFHSSNLRGTLAALGVMAFCILLCEGAMADWSAIYVGDLPGGTHAVAALGYAAFSAAMAAGRLVGDACTRRFGARGMVRYGGGVAAAGLFLAIAGGNLATALIGLACAGAGYASTFPIITSAAGRLKRISAHAGIATVTTTGYLGFLVGPPLIGLLSEAVGLRVALTVTIMLSGVTILLADAVGPNPRVVGGSLARATP